MDVMFAKVINNLEFVKTLAFELEEHDVLSLQTKKDIRMMNMKAQCFMEDHVNNLKGSYKKAFGIGFDVGQFVK
jgi:hypothetical protein